VSDLAALTARVRDDLERTAHPTLPWLEPRIAPDGQQALDVLIVGGGQSGVATAFGLMRSQVRNILVVDRAPRGLEGPWRTYARMPTLRSPKDYTGPDLNIPSLTYRSWHEATYGVADWQALPIIPREHWADYLLWFRDAVGVAVQNETAAVGIAPSGGLLAVTLRDAAGRETIRHARKVVLATGQEGTGDWWMPDFVAALPRHLRANTPDAIDFARLRGRRVAVLGAGASAFDNAATALEAGAASVDLHCRRLQPQTIQPYRWLTFAGFLRHLSDLDDEWRWRFMSTIKGMREGFPQATYDRCAQHANFRLLTGQTWTDARALPDGGVEVTTGCGAFRADFLICATGIRMDFASRPELSHCADNIATWADRYTPPEAERNDRLAQFPYLADDYAFTEREPGRTPWIADLHLFAIASTMSFGASGSSINAMTTAVPKLVHGLTRGLFRGDVEKHWAALQAYDIPQAIIRPR
jgi:cation diffusion facilitator CzcD-associated flavoprotein CzcO